MIGTGAFREVKTPLNGLALRNGFLFLFRAGDGGPLKDCESTCEIEAFRGLDTPGALLERSAASIDTDLGLTLCIKGFRVETDLGR